MEHNGIILSRLNTAETREGVREGRRDWDKGCSIFHYPKSLPGFGASGQKIPWDNSEPVPT